MEQKISKTEQFFFNFEQKCMKMNKKVHHCVQIWAALVNASFFAFLKEKHKKNSF
jgi:hypothetical protein